MALMEEDDVNCLCLKPICLYPIDMKQKQRKTNR